MNDGIEGVSYDTAAHQVTVTVSYNVETDKMTASVKYDGANSLTITNTFAPAEASPEVTKALTGREWTDDDSFTFTLAAVTEGAPLPATVTGTATKAQPKVSFGTITFNKAGTYEYTITETAGSIPGVTRGFAGSAAAEEVICVFSLPVCSVTSGKQHYTVIVRLLQARRRADRPWHCGKKTEGEAFPL